MLLLTACLASLLSWTVGQPTVSVNGVVFNGVLRENSRAFCGIKYANSLRFQPPIPVPVSSLNNPYDATSVGAMCIQQCKLLPQFSCVSGAPSEDCLFLNIFTPLGNPQGKAVILFIHGGNFQEGSGGGIVYDGNQMVKLGDVILVTINYRMGILGFLGTRNLGILDMGEALSWVHTNIAAFGGNPNKITVMGQSAGAMGAAILLSNSDTSSLIKRAILHSYPFSLVYRTAAEGLLQETQFAAEVGCSMGDMDCYNSLSASDILAQQFNPNVYTFSSNPLSFFMVWGPVIDGPSGIVKDHPHNLFVNGYVEPKDTILGTVREDAMGFIPVNTEPWDQTRLLTEAAAIDPNLVQLIELQEFFNILPNSGVCSTQRVRLSVPNLVSRISQKVMNGFT